MARATNKDLRGKTIYSMFIRNHTEKGDFAAATADLGRIKELGVDIVLLLPFFLSDGNPYSVKDSRVVDPEYGGMEGFKQFAAQAHSLGMQLAIEIVFNHASRESALLAEHPGWFYVDAEGKMSSRTLNKPEVYDFNYENEALWGYQIETLSKWAEYVDGFSCNLAPLVPLDFWLKAREALEQKKPGLIWIADTLDLWLVIEHRARGFTAHSECEEYQAFDVCSGNYARRVFTDYMKAEIPLSAYTMVIESQDAWFPDNYCILRYLENIGTRRIRSIIAENAVVRSWTAFMYMQKGMPLIYAGQENSCQSAPSLTGKDPVDWGSGPDLSGLLRNLYKIKKNPIISQGAFYITANDRLDVATVRYIIGGKWLEGSFSLKGKSGIADTFVPDGQYLNLIDYSVVNVKHGKYGVDENPVIFCSEYKA